MTSPSPANTVPANLTGDRGGSRCTHQVGAGSLVDEAEDDGSGKTGEGLVGEVAAGRGFGDAHLFGHVGDALVEHLAGRCAGHRHTELGDRLKEIVDALVAPGSRGHALSRPSGERGVVITAILPPPPVVVEDCCTPPSGPPARTPPAKSCRYNLR